MKENTPKITWYNPLTWASYALFVWQDYHHARKQFNEAGLPLTDLIDESQKASKTLTISVVKALHRPDNLGALKKSLVELPLSHIPSAGEVSELMGWYLEVEVLGCIDRLYKYVCDKEDGSSAKASIIDDLPFHTDFLKNGDLCVIYRDDCEDSYHPILVRFDEHKNEFVEVKVFEDSWPRRCFSCADVADVQRVSGGLRLSPEQF